MSEHIPTQAGLASDVAAARLRHGARPDAMIARARPGDVLDRQRENAAIAAGIATLPQRGEPGYGCARIGCRRDELAAPPAAADTGGTPGDDPSDGNPSARDEQVTRRDRLDSPRTPAAGWDRAPVRVSLLGGFRLTRGGVTHELPRDAQHLVALLALRRPMVPRTAAALLTPHVEAESAVAHLRATLSRLESTGLHILGADRSMLSLAEGVTVDTREAEAFSDRLAAGAGDPGWGADHEQLLLELLPGWTDDWVRLERERFRDLSLYALDVEIRRLLDAGDRRTATTAAQKVLRVDPLRESTLRLLIEVHLTEGDDARARDCYLDFRRTLLEALGIEPSPEARALVAHLLDGDGLA